MKALEQGNGLSPFSTRISDVIRRIESYQLEIAEHRQKLEAVRDQLRESYARYENLYELAPVAFLALDKQACICEINAKGASLLGFRSNWLIGRPFLTFVAKNDIQ